MGRWGIVLYSEISLSSFVFLKVELTLVRFDHKNKKVQLLLKGHELLPVLHELNKKIEDG
jgi:hypothetical protein